MNKTMNKYSPEVRERAVRMVLDGAGQHESRWAASPKQPFTARVKTLCFPHSIRPIEKPAEPSSQYVAAT